MTETWVLLILSLGFWRIGCNPFLLDNDLNLNEKLSFAFGFDGF